jgi:hypothetical protein
MGSHRIYPGLFIMSATIQSITTGQSNGNSVAISVTPAGLNRAIYVFVGTNEIGGTNPMYVTSVVKGSQNGVKVTDVIYAGPNDIKCEVWKIVNPNTTTENVTVTCTQGNGGLRSLYCAVVCISGTSGREDGTASEYNSTSTPSVTVTSNTGSIVIDCLMENTSYIVTEGGGQTNRWGLQIGGYTDWFDGSSEAGAYSSVVMSQSLSGSPRFCHIAVSIKAGFIIRGEGNLLPWG